VAMAAPVPVTITVSPFEWRTLPFAGEPTLVGIRQVQTPDGAITQGFVIDRAALAMWLSSQAGDMVTELHSSDSQGAVIAPHWAITVEPSPAAMARAAADGRGAFQRSESRREKRAPHRPHRAAERARPGQRRDRTDRQGRCGRSEPERLSGDRAGERTVRRGPRRDDQHRRARAHDSVRRRIVGLDGVLAQQRSYERRGFVLAYRNVRWRTIGGGEPSTALVPLSSVPFEQLLAYDAGVFGADRERFLRAWIDRQDGHALAYMREGALAGYGVLRPCQVGAKVGPLFADDAEAAEQLLAGLTAGAGEGTEVFVDMPTANPRTQRLCAGREMEPTFETVRMYLNGRPSEDVQRVYGVTTFEFG